MAKVETERFFGNKGIIIMIRDGNKFTSAIFKDKKNADKFNRNNPSDVKKLLQLAKKTKFPKAIDEGPKRYNQKDGVGKSKYVISYHDGKKKHKDGSDFFDIQIFRNKKDLAKFVNALHKGGYKYGFGESVNEGSMDWEKHFKGYNEKELKVISKFIFMNPQGIDGVIKMSKHKPRDFKKTIQKAAKAGLYESVNEAFLVAYGKGPKPIKPAFAAYADKKMAQKFMADMKKDGYKVMMTQKKIRGVDESVNEASKEAMGIAGFTGTRGVAVDDFIKKNKIDARKLFNFVRKGNLRDRMDFVTAIAGKPNNKFFKMIVGRFAESVNENKYRMMKRSSATKMLNKKLTIKRIGSRERFDIGRGKPVKLNGFAFYIPGKGYIGMKDGGGMPYTPLGGKKALQQILDDGGFLDYKPNIFINPVDESVNEDKNQIVQLKKKVGKSEIKFYDALSKIEKKLGKKKYRAFLEKGLKDFKINAKHYDYRSNGDAEEKLFQLAK